MNWQSNKIVFSIFQRCVFMRKWLLMLWDSHCIKYEENSGFLKQISLMMLSLKPLLAAGWTPK